MNVRLERKSIQQPDLLIRRVYHTCVCGSSQPEQLVQFIQESACYRLPLAESLPQRPKCKQPSCRDGCLEAVLDRDAVVCSLTIGNLS